MKKGFLMFALAALPLSAQSWEVGAFMGQQAYQDFTASTPSGSGSASSDSKTVFSARLGYSLVDFGPVLLQVTLGYQPEASTTTKAIGAGTLSGIGNFSGDLKQSHASAGIMFNFKALVAVGAGVEYRSEKLTSGGTSATFGRPWARANIGMAFPTPLVKPFLGLEVAVPLATKSNDIANTEESLKSLAPRLQVGLYGGIRF